jgi:hypothetical protein
MRIAVPLLACAIAAAAQSYSSHSGWSFTDTLQTATDVVVADIAAGSAVDNGSEVTVNATLHGVRLLNGGLNPNSDVAIVWHYRPSPVDGPAVTTKVPNARGLWFLRKNSAGAFEPLQAGEICPMGNTFLPLGSSTPSYAETEPLQSKVAREIAAALEDLAPDYAAALAAPRPSPRGTSPSWMQPRALIGPLVLTLRSLDRVAAADAYRSLSALPDATMKLLSLFGRLRAGDTSAAAELEKNLDSAKSAPPSCVPWGPTWAGSIRPRTLP